MKQDLDILLLEDSAADALLIRETLRRGGLVFDLQHVAHRAAFVHHLEQTAPGLILSDFTLPDLNGYEALDIALKKCPAAPFIFVTGTLGEEVAIETLRMGATDYVLKHRLAELVPAVHRALHQAKERSNRRQAEQQLRQSHEQLRALSLYLQFVREDERIRVASEVHEELGQALAGLKLELDWLTRRLPHSLNPLRARSLSMARGIDKTLHVIRRITTELRPALLDSAGLPAALEWQAEQFQKQTGIRCDVTAAVPGDFWDQDLNTAFFRIFEAALSNVVRHARASEVRAHLRYERGQLVLEVQDNGRGISEEEIYSARSLGLLEIRERAALLDGDVRWLGERGKGTTVVVRISHPPPWPRASVAQAHA